MPDENAKTTGVRPGYEAGPAYSEGALMGMGPPDLIYKQMAKVMADMGAVGKNKKSGGGLNYAFRGIDDVMAALNPALIKNKVFLTPHIVGMENTEFKTSKGSTMQHTIVTVDYTFYAEDGSHVTARAPGEGADVGDKSVNKAMAGAFKYMATQTFCTPTEEAKDSELENPDLSGGGKRPGPRPTTSETTLAAIIETVCRMTDAKKIRTFYAMQRDEGLMGDHLLALEIACSKRVDELKEEEKLTVT